MGGGGGSWLEHPVFSALVSNFTRREKEKEKRRPEIRLGSKAGGGGGGLLISAYASSYHCLAETSVECTFQIYLSCGSSVFERYQRLQAEDLPEGRGGEGEGL